MSLSTTLASSPIRATKVRDAMIIWVASTTVGAERKRMTGQLAKARGVFGTYAETTQPGLQRLVAALRDLAGQPENATLIPAPHEFGATPASRLLPRGARVVGWLDADGYRGVTDTPQPCPEWLRERQADLRAQRR
jgi:hypothetical protein